MNIDQIQEKLEALKPSCDVKVTLSGYTLTIKAVSVDAILLLSDLVCDDLGRLKDNVTMHSSRLYAVDLEGYQREEVADLVSVYVESSGFKVDRVEDNGRYQARVKTFNRDITIVD